MDDDSKDFLEVKAIVLGLIEAHIAVTARLCHELRIGTEGIENVLTEMMALQAKIGGEPGFIKARQRPVRMIAHGLRHLREMNEVSQAVPKHPFKVYDGGLVEVLGDHGRDKPALSDAESGREYLKNGCAEHDESQDPNDKS